jgi:heme-degrading monooxygenase HmoA
VLARVMTFYSARADVSDLVQSLRSEIPAVYEPFPGFRGMLVLERPDTRNHVIALTLWEDAASLVASETLADAFAERIAHAAGTSVTRSVYDVLGSIGIPDRTQATD